MSKTDVYICVCIFSFEAVGATDIVDKKLYLSLFLCLFDAARHDRHCSRYISGEALITVFCPTPDIHSSAHADEHVGIKEVLNLIKSFIVGRKFRVTLDNYSSNVRNVPSGIPQDFYSKPFIVLNLHCPFSESPRTTQYKMSHVR